jgi:hypothetical protein
MGVLGAGLALQIKNKWPKVALASEELCKNSNPLGTAQLIKVEEHLWVANIYGQYKFGRHGVYTDYTAVSKAFYDLKSQLNGQSIYIPKNMGCGLAGGVWSLYSEIVNVILPDTTIIELE